MPASVSANGPASWSVSGLCFYACVFHCRALDLNFETVVQQRGAIRAKNVSKTWTKLGQIPICLLFRVRHSDSDPVNVTCPVNIQKVVVYAFVVYRIVFAFAKSPISAEGSSDDVTTNSPSAYVRNNDSISATRFVENSVIERPNDPGGSLSG